MPSIYFDNSATTRPDDEVIEAMSFHLRQTFGNASSVHTFGQQARAVAEEARLRIAELIGADTREVVFTSGGTESDNAALWGAFRGGHKPGNHIVTTRIEHAAILATCKALESAGAEVTYVPVRASGRVDLDDVARALTDRTILISVMHVNNETGVIQPVEEIGALARERGILMHTDAVQAAGKVPLRVRDLGVDLLTLSAHKFHGPKGIGVLFIRNGTKLAPFITGGSHERKRRAGTENVPAIAGMGIAARLARERLPEMDGRVAGLRDRLETEACRRIEGVQVNGSGPRVPSVTNLSFEGIEGEAAVISLDLAGLAVSTGSACSSGSLEPSHVLTAMGLRPEAVQSSLRFSLCCHSTEAEVDRALEILETVCRRLRGISRRHFTSPRSTKHVVLE